MTQAVEVIVYLKQGSYIAIPLEHNKAAEELIEKLVLSLAHERPNGLFRIGVFPNLYVVRTEDVSAFEVGHYQPQVEEGEEWKAS